MKSAGGPALFSIVFKLFFYPRLRPLDVCLYAFGSQTRILHLPVPVKAALAGAEAKNCLHCAARPGSDLELCGKGLLRVTFCVIILKKTERGVVMKYQNCVNLLNNMNDLKRVASAYV